MTAPRYSGGDVAGELRRFAGLLAGRAGHGVISWPDVRTAPGAAGYRGWLVIGQLSGPASLAGAAGLAADAAGLRLLMETSSVSAIDGG
jgi:hypothetical protein